MKNKQAGNKLKSQRRRHVFPWDVQVKPKCSCLCPPKKTGHCLISCNVKAIKEMKWIIAMK